MKLKTLICFLYCVFATDSHKHAIIEDIFRSIERTLAFYESNKILITLDDVFALRLLEGQILVMNNRLSGSSVHASNDLRSNFLPRLTTLYHYSKNLSSTALDLLYRNFQWRSRAKSDIYLWPWTFGSPYRHLDPSLKWPAAAYLSSIDDFSKYEELCFAELIKNGFNCNIARACIRVMFSRGQKLHEAVQQLLYTVLAEQSGCTLELNLRLSSSEPIDKWQAELCTNIFFTISNRILKNGNIVPPQLKGVFLNMALLCPFVGYLEFLHIDWLRQILSWQTSFGCWGSAQHSMENVLTRVKSANKAVRQKKEEAGYKHYPLKAQSNSAVGDFMIKRDGMKRLQEFDPEMIKQFQTLRQEQEQNRTIRKRRFRYGVTLMTTVFVRRRPPRNQSAEKTKEQKAINNGFLNESLPLTETSDRVHSPLPLPEGCVARFTALAFGALSQYLRFCLLAPLAEINPVDYLFGTNYIINPYKLSTDADEAGLPVRVYTTQRRPNAAAAAVKFGDRNLDHNIAEDSSEYAIKNKVDRDHIWADANPAKLVVKANPNPVEMFDENDRNDEDGGLALGAQEEEDAVDYSFPPDEVMNVVGVSRDFGGKGTRDRGIQGGDYDSYYDNMDDDNGGDQPIPWRFDHDRLVKLTRSSSQVMTEVGSRFDAVMTVGRTYSVLLGVMFLFIWLLYKILLKRRTGLVYRYSHWK